MEIAYLNPDGRAAHRLRLPRKLVGSAPAGVAVRLSRLEAEMVVGEGVVTTLSAMARFDLPGWALLSAGNLARWSPPVGVRRVLIAGDRGRAGEAAAPAQMRRQAVVRLGDLEIAPENLRHGEAPDDDIPQLADTIAAAGLLQFPTVRPGRGDEAAYMVLDGRRRLLGLRLLRDGGFIDDDHPVEVFVETDRARQAAAVVLTNTAVPVHVADVVAAIGRMLKARLGVKAIARALGYGEIEIRRLAALSALPAVALEALKTGRITLRQARLLARLKDADAQAELAQAVLDGHGLPEWRIQEQLGEGRITNRDPRCGLVTPELYNAGPTRVARLGRIPAIRETEQYVATVIECYLALTAGRDVRNSRACRRPEAGL